MIDYAYLCQAIEHWRSGQRPAAPPLPSSDVEELDADVMMDDDDEGYAEPAYDGYEQQGDATQQGYVAQQGYEQQGYEQQGYEQQGYEQPLSSDAQPTHDAQPSYEQQGYETQHDYEQPEAGDVTMAYGASLPETDDEEQP